MNRGSRTPCSSPATSPTTRSATSSTLALAVLDGGGRPGHGAPGYEGVQAAAPADPFYHRPDLDAPRHPGRSPPRCGRSAPGLHAPLYPLLGNHDLLVQGEMPPTAQIDAFATGDRLVPGARPGPPSRPVDDPECQAAVGALLGDPVAHSPTLESPPTSGRRRAHGPGAAELPRTAARRSTTPPISATTRPRDHCSTPSTAPAPPGPQQPGQLAWLLAQLARPATAPIVVCNHNPLDPTRPSPALAASPRVVAAVAGNSPQEPPSAPPRPLLAASPPPRSPTSRCRRACSACARRATGFALETWMVDHDGKRPRRHRPRARLPRRPGRPPAALRGRPRRPQRATLRLAVSGEPLEDLALATRVAEAPGDPQRLLELGPRPWTVPECRVGLRPRRRATGSGTLDRRR